MPELWIPEQARRVRAEQKRRAIEEFLAENYEDYEALRKGIEDSPLARLPRKLTPGLAALGAYRGLKDPMKGTERSFALLRSMGTVHAARIVIEQRILQVLSFCVEAVNDTEPGYKIIMRDCEGRPSHHDKQRMRKISDILQKGGVWRPNPRTGRWGVWAGDGYSSGWPFLELTSALLRDSLTIDQAAVFLNPGIDPEILPVGSLEPVDGAQVRRTMPRLPRALVAEGQGGGYEPYTPVMRSVEEEIAWVLLKPQATIADSEPVLQEFTEDELGVWIRWPRTDWWTMGYGFSELESLMEILIGIIHSIGFNTSMFTVSSIPPGLISLSGNFSEEWLTDFLYTIVTNCAGPGNWHKLPAIIGDPESKVNYIPLRGNQGQDMQWREFLILCLNLLCAGYHMASEEVNFQAFLTRGGQLTGEGGAERVAMAQETGLRGLLRSYAAFLNRCFITRFYPDRETGLGPYALVFTGQKPDDEAAQQQRQTEAINSGARTLNEVRALADEPPYRDPVDKELWRRIEQRALEMAPYLRNDPVQLDEVVCRVYTKHGGQLRDWPDLPIAVNALQARMQEIQQEQMEGQGGAAPGPAGAPAGPETGMPSFSTAPQQEEESPDEAPEPAQKSLLQRLVPWWGARRHLRESGRDYDPETVDVYLEG